MSKMNLHQNSRFHAHYRNLSCQLSVISCQKVVFLATDNSQLTTDVIERHNYICLVYYKPNHYNNRANDKGKCTCLQSTPLM